MKYKALILTIMFFLSFSLADVQEMHPQAPNFRLKSVNGHDIDLHQNLAGKSVIIIFWASWCEPGVQQIMELAKLNNKLPKDTAVITVALGDNWKTLRPYYKDKNNPFPYEIYYGGKWMAKMYTIWGMPTTYILDKDHHIREKYSGYINAKKLIAAIKKIS